MKKVRLWLRVCSQMFKLAIHHGFPNFGLLKQNIFPLVGCHPPLNPLTVQLPPKNRNRGEKKGILEGLHLGKVPRGDRDLRIIGLVTRVILPKTPSYDSHPQSISSKTNFVKLCWSRWILLEFFRYESRTKK